MSGSEASEKALGKAIQRARQAFGMTQQELCNVAGLSYSTLTKIERGAIKTPSVFTVARIASSLGVPLDSLLDGSDITTQPMLKKRSRSGISFVYVDINGCLVHFFHSAFSRISMDKGVSAELVETAFWHYNDAVCKGEMSLDAFNESFARQLRVDSIDWTSYYMDSVEPITEMIELMSWLSKNYKVGLLSNIMPGYIKQMIDRGLLPKISYDVIIDSSEVGYIKPEPQIYSIASSKAGVPGDEILFIDDSRTNLMAAEQFGWKVMWFDDLRPEESVRRIKSALEF